MNYIRPMGVKPTYDELLEQFIEIGNLKDDVTKDDLKDLPYEIIETYISRIKKYK